MSNGNPFYVKPAGAMADLSPLFTGLGAVAQRHRAKKDSERRQADISQALQSGDTAQIMELHAKYPDLSESISNQIGFANERTRSTMFDAYEGLELAIQDAEIVDDEGNVTGYDQDILQEAADYFDTKVTEVESYGGQPRNMGYDRERLFRDPQAVKQTIQTGKLLLEPDLYSTLAGEKLPKSIQEWKVFSQLDPQQQKQYLDMKRGGWKVTEVAGKPSLVSTNYIPGVEGTEQPGQVIPLSTVQEEAAAIAEKKGAEKTAVAKATAEAEAAVDIPRMELQADSMTNVLDQLLQHPARELATGKSGALLQMAPELLTAGSPYADFRALQDQVKGKTFLQAYEGLKGGGQITEIEGKKAEDAFARLKAAQSDQGFFNALQDFKVEVSRLRDLGYRKAGAKEVYNKRTGDLFWQLPDGTYKPRYE